MGFRFVISKISSPIVRGSCGIDLRQMSLSSPSVSRTKFVGIPALSENVNRLNDALDLLEKLSRRKPFPSMKVFNGLLSDIVKMKNYSTAISVFRKMCWLGFPINECTLNIVINSCCRACKCNLGFSILGWFFKLGCMPCSFTFDALLRGLFQENRIVEAQELFKKIVREDLCELDVVLYGSVINGLVKGGNTIRAVELLRAMEKVGVAVDTHIYSIIIDGFCKHRMIDSAFKIFDEMVVVKGITPNIVTYNSLVSGLSSLNKWKKVKFLIKEMIECKVYPDVFTFNYLIDALCKEGMVDVAEDLRHIMLKRGVAPNIVSYSTLMDGFCLQGRVSEACKIFHSLAGKNISPDVYTYSILIHGYCKVNKLDHAMELFHEMFHKGLDPNIVTYTIVLRGLFSGGRCSSALRLFNELEALGLKPTFYTYCNMLDGLCQNGNVEHALEFLSTLEEKSVSLHISYYNIIMDELCKIGQLDMAQAIFSNLRSKGLKPDVVTYAILIQGCCNSGKLEEGKDLLLRMFEVNLSPNQIIYNAIVRGILMRGRYGDAMKFLEEMHANGFYLNSSTFALFVALVGKRKHNPIIVNMIEKFVPDAYKYCSGAKVHWSYQS